MIRRSREQYGPQGVGVNPAPPWRESPTLWSHSVLESSFDPFAMTADPAAYVRREATERALAELVRLLLESSAPVALTGPPGLGKTMLLRRVEQELVGRFQTVYLPYTALPPEGICTWALRVLSAAPGPNPEAEFVALARRLAASGHPLLLLLDEGTALPPATARGLVDLCGEARGALRLLVAASDDSRCGPILAAFGPALREVRLNAPMSAAETAAYVRDRLALAHAPRELRLRFDDRAVADLYAESAGVPRLVDQMASLQLLQQERRELGFTPPPDPTAAPAREPLELDEAAASDAQPFLGPGDLMDAAAFEQHVVARDVRERVRSRRLAPMPSLQRIAVAALVVAALAASLPALAVWLTRALP